MQIMSVTYAAAWMPCSPTVCMLLPVEAGLVEHTISILMGMSIKFKYAATNALSCTALHCKYAHTVAFAHECIADL